MRDQPAHELSAELHRLPLDPDVTVPVPPPPLRRLLRDHADLLPVIAAGGALGSLARWGVGSALPHRAGELPWGTLVANVSGSLLLGLLMALVLDVWSGRRYVRPFLGVGVLGGYTTFSTSELEVRGLLASGRAGLAVAYLAGSVAAALVAVTAGVVAGRVAIDARRRRTTTRGARP